ncbi:hypothetical protein AHMF7616_00452 [Adhaeribacter pallidiroseus]|uniref:IPT/TIG domain-containing protein n=2 Tax=Adhaeribacter pallidiroseus TaxID=2072847 RepID=A0A369QAC9_9BACT|nr:hypothetical protein AHMF7616_00452 [Adhaeribacter pallidiroseus]
MAVKQPIHWRIALGMVLLVFFSACKDDEPESKPLPPTITSIMPDSAYVNDTITITGTNFDPDPFNMSVQFSGVEAFNIVAASTTAMRVKVPKGATSGLVTVTIAEQTSPGVNFKILTVIPTTITSISPQSGYYGDTVTIAGTGIVPADFTAGTSTVLFNGATALPAAAIINPTAKQLQVIVPDDAQTGPIGLNLKNGTVLETDTFRLTPPLPTVTTFTPTSGPEGTPVTITGANLGVSSANEIQVTLNGINAVITSRTATQLKITVPAGMKPGKYPFIVKVRNHAATSPTAFTVTAPPVASQYLYFAQGSEIRRASITEKDGKVTVTHAPLFTDLGDVSDIVIDKAGNKLYWSSIATNQIMVGNLNGSGNPQLVFEGNDNVEVNYPTGLAMANGKVYWANQGSSSIARANPDGSSPEILFDAQDNVNYAQDIEMEVVGNKLYWTNVGTAQILRGNVNGSGTTEEVFGPDDNLQYPLGLKLDANSGKLYVADSPTAGGVAPTDRLLSGNLNGTGGLTALFESGEGVEAVFAVAIDTKGGYIYWITNNYSGNSKNRLLRGKLDGSGKPQILIDNLESFGNAIAVQVE